MSQAEESQKNESPRTTAAEFMAKALLRSGGSNPVYGLNYFRSTGQTPQTAEKVTPPSP